MWTRDTTQRYGRAGHSRRTVLRAGALLALGGAATPLTGCDLFDRGPEPAPRPDPLAPLITGALELAERYRSAIAASPELAARLTPISEAHLAHARELARVTGTALPSGTPTPGASAAAGTPAEILAALRTAEQQGRDAAAKACADAPAKRAALVGSIAAARAAHVEALR